MMALSSFMRLDVFLKLSRLILRRSLAKDFTQAGRVKVNGAAAKASHDIKEGDEVEIKKYDLIKTVKVIKIPSKKQVSRKDAPNLYEIVSEKIIEEESLLDLKLS